MKYPRVAIVTTLCNAIPILPSFIQYHLSTGFDHLFLFFDHPADTAYEWIRPVPHTTCFLNDEALHENWDKVRHRVDPKVYDFIDREAMARQQLNVAVAIEASLRMGIDWLLHIDIDELFYSPEESVEAHFRRLDEEGYAVYRYLNHEAIPEREDIQDFFKESTLFKLNPLLSASRKNTDALVAGLSQIPPKFFHYYSNGKAAARVTEALMPGGVHNFRLPHGQATGSATLAPVILHYPCCGFWHFQEKYKTLGAFGDAWFGRVDIRSGPGPTHVDARDIVAEGSAEKALAFYRHRFMIDDPATAEALIEHGHCVRIDRPARLLQSMEG